MPPHNPLVSEKIIWLFGNENRKEVLISFLNSVLAFEELDIASIIKAIGLSVEKNYGL